MFLRTFALGFAFLASSAVGAWAETCFNHDLGKTCLAQPAQKVAAFEIRQIENLLALGVKPLGVGSRDQMAAKIPSPLAADLAGVADFGLPATPELESMMMLGPDLILGGARNMGRQQDSLRLLAPVAGFEPYPSGGQNMYLVMESHLREVAKALERETAAEAVLAELDAEIAAARLALAAKGWAGRRVVLGNVNAGITGADVMLFNSNSLPAEIISRLGLDYAHHDPRHLDKAFEVTTVEALIAFEDIDFLYMPFNAEGVRNLMASPVWRGLGFVQAERLHEVGYQQMYGGPLSARAFLQGLIAALGT